MYVIKMEPNTDFKATERSVNTEMEEWKPLSEEVNILDLQVTGIKTECTDYTYDLKTEMTFDETPVPIDFPVLKSEAEERNILDLQVTGIKTECTDHTYDLKTEIIFGETPVPVDFPVLKSEAKEETRELNKTEEEEVKQEATTEEDEILTEGVGVPSSCDNITKDERVETAKSSAQRQREFRQRMKEQGRYEEWKEKEKVRSRKKRNALRKTELGRELLKAKNREHKRAQRLRENTRCKSSLIRMLKSKSSAQRQREFRQRIKEQGRYEEWKEKEKVRNRKKRNAIRKTKHGRELLKAKNREYKRAQRLREKLRLSDTATPNRDLKTDSIMENGKMQKTSQRSTTQLSNQRKRTRC
ncbi:uncharacterized protein [Periplaneta americana]|uniref:uncharacterized protein isoform X2 n=1 Tax=Periplaneta americana TaxID=6978 RepID=UPI0037E87244